MRRAYEDKGEDKGSHVTLYGSPLSLFTGRARSYLIKAGITFREVPPVTDHFNDVVLSLAGGRRSMPTVELADGQVIRDSVAIVDHFESVLGQPFTPVTPKQCAVSLLFDVIGAEGMLRPAMHYRWRFPENDPLLNHHFPEFIPQDASIDFTAAGGFQRMKQACDDLGAIEENVPLVESLYVRLLEKLNAHFALYPYLLGGKPSIGDFGLIASMYAHLGRDPKPRSLMYEHGIHVLRWVERMNRHDPDFSAAHAVDEEYLVDDEIPTTLIEVLQHLAIDFVPETEAACAQINEWLDARTELQSGTEVERNAGDALFLVEGQQMTASAQPFRFYVLKRLQNYVETLSDTQRLEVEDVLSTTTMQDVLKFKLVRGIGRANNLEVWQ